MKKVYSSIDKLVGRTPLLELSNIEKELNIKAKIIIKAEFFNPAGSSKDRVAKAIIEDAEKSGKLDKDSVIIEPTSGNTGIGLASVAAARGYKVIIVMPDNMSLERQRLMKAYGAKTVLSDGSEGMSGAIKKAEELAEKIPKAFLAGQFINPANPNAHYTSTGPEIYEDADGEVDFFIAGVGTGGTITGVGRYLKEKNPNIKIIAVEPDSSAVLSGEKAGAHKIQGIGAGFIPKVLDASIYDEVIRVSDEAAYKMSVLIGRKEGILVGISSGAAVCAAVEIAKRIGNEGKNIIVLAPDSGERYLSVGLFDNEGEQS